MKESLKKIKNGGFSLIELVIVIAVLAILTILGGPYFLRLINLARFESAKNHMRDSFTSCINSPDVSPSNLYIPGITFQSSNCSSSMSATIDNSCTISMDMSTGAKTGWDSSYEECSNSASNTASNNSNGNNNKISDWTAYANETASLEPISPQVLDASCETTWAGVSRTGKAEHATDGDKSTKWTCDGMATIDFDLGEKQEIRSVNVEFSGDVTNGNYIKIYVDEKVVAEGTQPCCGDGKTWFIEPTRGQRIRYETVEKPHTLNLYGVDRGEEPQLQSATWSEIGELTVNGPYSYRTNKGNSRTATGIFSGN